MHGASAITTFDAAAILVVLAALLGYLNVRFIGLAPSVGLTVMGAVASWAVIGLDAVIPGNTINADIVRFIRAIDFRETLLNGMLSFLLFAGALHVNLDEIRRGRLVILVLSTVGVVLSTVLVGGGFYLLATMAGLAVPLLWCMAFGALISPTDPVAVMAVMGRTNIPPTLQATIAGESLYNDGVGVVVFSIVLAAALGTATFTPAGAALQFAREAGGGVLLGYALGWLGCRSMRSIDDYNVEVMISLAIVMGGYALANALHVSGPVAMATAGLFIGNEQVAAARLDNTRSYLLRFWSIIDNVLNAMLFMLIGLEVVAVPFDPRSVIVGLGAVVVALAARAISVLLPLALLRPWLWLGSIAPVALIWGGLRGGISVALALGLPESPWRGPALAATYIVVLFSVVVQGGTIERVLRRRGLAVPDT